MKLFAPVLLAVCCLLAMPAAAMAVTYTVDSTGDEADLLPGTGGCLTAGGKCSLRAAIEESNFSTGVTDEIVFTAAFDGQLADTIALGSSLPPLEERVHIDGDSSGQCATEAAVAGPCAGVSGPATGAALTVEADDVEVEGLAMTGASGAGGTAINVINASERLRSTRQLDRGQTRR